MQLFSAEATIALKKMKTGKNWAQKLLIIHNLCWPLPKSFSNRDSFLFQKQANSWKPTNTAKDLFNSIEIKCFGGDWRKMLEFSQFLETCFDAYFFMKTSLFACVCSRKCWTSLHCHTLLFFNYNSHLWLVWIQLVWIVL
mgnify:CR=1 FL=1